MNQTASGGNANRDSVSPQPGADEIAIHRRRVDCIDGFRLLGAKISPRGATEAHVLVRTGEVTHKRYRAYRRAGDGHTVYRWGRLVGAEVIQYGNDPTDFIVVFIPESSNSEPLSDEWLRDYEQRFGKPFSSDSGASR